MKPFNAFFKYKKNASCLTLLALLSLAPSLFLLQAARAELASTQKRKATENAQAAAATAAAGGIDEGDEAAAKRAKKDAKRAKKAAGEATASGSNSLGEARLFVGKLPLAVEASAVKALLAEAAQVGGDSGVSGDGGGGETSPAACAAVVWLTDKATGAFYGSCFAQMASLEHATRAAAYFAPGGQGSSGAGGAAAAQGAAGGSKKAKQAKKAAAGASGAAAAAAEGNGSGGASSKAAAAACGPLWGRKLRVNAAPPKDGEVWPPAGGFTHLPRPPVM